MNSFFEGVILIVLGVGLCVATKFIGQDFGDTGVLLIGYGVRHLSTDSEVPPKAPGTSVTSEKVEVTQTPAPKMETPKP
jgi:hypothetical protein